LGNEELESSHSLQVSPPRQRYSHHHIHFASGSLMSPLTQW